MTVPDKAGYVGGESRPVIAGCNDPTSLVSSRMYSGNLVICFLNKVCTKVVYFGYEESTLIPEESVLKLPVLLARLFRLFPKACKVFAGTVGL